MTDSCSPHPRYRLYTTLASYTPWLRGADNAAEQLEARICREFGVGSAICVPRGRTGLYLALMEMIRPGQEVIMSPLTIVDAVNAVRLSGGVPVFCDIRRESCSIDPEKAERLIGGRTSAILQTHLHGQAADTLRLHEICLRHGLMLIEDAAQAFGAVEKGRHAGTNGDAGIYSFGFFKNLSTWRGGMVVSNDRALIARIRSRLDGFEFWKRRGLLATALCGLIVDIGTLPPIFPRLAYPAVRRNIGLVDRLLDPERLARRLEALPPDHRQRMRSWQARLALVHLNRVELDTAERLVRARLYHGSLGELPGLIVPRWSDDCSNIYTHFPIQIRDRSGLVQYGRSRGRDLAPQHLRNCADLPAFRELYRDCPNARATASELTLLPTYPRYPIAEVQRNIETVQEFIVRTQE